MGNKILKSWIKRVPYKTGFLCRWHLWCKFELLFSWLADHLPICCSTSSMSLLLPFPSLWRTSFLPFTFTHLVQTVGHRFPTGTAIEAGGCSFLYLSEQVTLLTHLICHCVELALGLSSCYNLSSCCNFHVFKQISRSPPKNIELPFALAQTHVLSRSFLSLEKGSFCPRSYLVLKVDAFPSTVGPSAPFACSDFFFSPYKDSVRMCELCEFRDLVCVALCGVPNT